MVGALLVSGVETVWSGIEIPPYGGPITVKDYRGEDIVLERFAEMARFNYGSTVIVLLPKGVAELAPHLSANRRCARRTPRDAFVGWVSARRRNRGRGSDGIAARNPVRLFATSFQPQALPRAGSRSAAA